MPKLMNTKKSTALAGLLLATAAIHCAAQQAPKDDLDYRNVSPVIGKALQMPSDAEIRHFGDQLTLPGHADIVGQQDRNREVVNQSMQRLSTEGQAASTFRPVDKPASADEKARYGDALAKTQSAVAARVSAAGQAPRSEAAAGSQEDKLQRLLRQQEQAGRKLQNRAASGTTDVPEDAFLIFVSFSMPREVLSNLAEQAKVAGGVMVLRGMVDGKLSATKQAALQANEAGAAWEINPELFSIFDVQTVPAFVLTGNKSVLDEGCAPDADGQCSSRNTFSKLSGDVSARVALDTMRMRSNIPYIQGLAIERLSRFKGLE